MVTGSEKTEKSVMIITKWEMMVVPLIAPSKMALFVNKVRSLPWHSQIFADATPSLVSLNGLTTGALFVSCSTQLSPIMLQTGQKVTYH